ncbi:ABC transporter substrate-binding protein [Pontibacillus yanchengensis]|uniref:ABC transporter substrate-binding protein n=2 Tax=Pontibacillus yanchengensis TaxID=462910 RepID=A0ACC7VDD1_9BACI|nr:cobalamin-binding protein [Pontibacillus yanchengensis]MYL32410.1 ABC transporter substrate-binding protein [Pontibacillus yanchengensis]MYL52991.1 ABC transporter substrate-binding protein [Pontibacillus yanchengensis]
MRLVSICPSNTELVAYLGLMDQLVGVDQWSDWPEEVKDLPQLGPDLSIDMDEVEKLKPDLVLASLSVPGMEKNIDELNKRNLPYIILNPNSLEDIAKDLLKVGEHTGVSERADRVVNQFRNLIQEYEELAETIEDKPRVYWEWWPKPIFTPGGTNWLTEITRLAGAENVYSHKNQASIQTEWDEVLGKNPDVICMAWVGVAEKKMKPELIQKRPGWEQMRAVRHNRIYPLEEALFCRPSPRLLYGLQKLAYLLHPTVYPNVEEEDPIQFSLK